MATTDVIDSSPDGTTAPQAVVLHTKLTPPGIRPEHMARRGVGPLLDEARCKLALVTAPPGFGKTTLLAEWAAKRGPITAWLSLDEYDNDPARFFTYLAAAVERVVPEFGGRAVAVLRSPGADLHGAVVPLILNDLSGLGRRLVLIADDYHLITNPVVHEALAHLIERLPEDVTLTLSTREDPPLPLGRLRARGELVEIRADQLRFTDEETATFLTESLGLNLSEADIARLWNRTEGWPAALYLAALSLRDRPDASAVIEDFAGDDRFLVDYLTSELLAQQPVELRSFLLRTSVLTRFCGSLCDAVLERADSGAVLQKLERSNMLLIPLDTKRRWYRYHHLFADLLTAELKALDPEAVAGLHRRASAWYLDAGLVVEAAHHAGAAGDLRVAVELVASHYAFFVEQGQLTTVLHWLAMLPEAVAAQDWLVCFVGGVVSAHAGLLDQAERWLRLADQAPAVPRDGQESTAPVAALAGYLRLLRGDISGTVSNARRALAAAATADPVWALGPQMVLAPGLWWAHELEEAKAVLEAATRTAQAVGVPATTLYALGIRAAIALEENDEPAAEALAREAIDLMHQARLDEHPWSAMAHIVHGILLGRHGELDPAAKEIEHGVAFGERLRAWQLTTFACLALAEIRQRQHDVAAARKLLSRVRDLLRTLPDPGDGFARLERAEKTLRLRATTLDRASAPYWELSRRELDVLRLLSSQLSQREIAAELYVSFNTVRTHVRGIFQKLGVSTRGEAVDRARDVGLL